MATAIHAMATFGGIGDGCVTIIETLNMFYDEGPIENSASTSAYLLELLEKLQAKYPKIIK